MKLDRHWLWIALCLAAPLAFLGCRAWTQPRPDPTASWVTLPDYDPSAPFQRADLSCGEQQMIYSNAFPRPLLLEYRFTNDCEFKASWWLAKYVDGSPVSTMPWQRVPGDSSKAGELEMPPRALLMFLCSEVNTVRQDGCVVEFKPKATR